MTSRSYLSIGDVLTLLRQEFPDVTISKIRFLESQGLVNPERTPSGYRKFYEHDVERLRWVLQQQRENFLPLKVIKDRLDDDANGVGDGEEATKGAEPESSGAAPGWRTGPAARAEPVLVGQRTSASPSASGAAAGEEREATPLRTGATLPGIESAGHPSRTSRDRAGAPSEPLPPAAVAASGPARVRSERPADSDRRPDPAGAKRPSRSDAGALSGAAPSRRSGGGADEPAADRDRASAGAPADLGGVSLSLEELSAACGLGEEALRELQEYGLLTATRVAGLDYFDQEAVAVATVAAGFARFGVEPRHLRLYKNAADREAGFVEQIVLPLVRQRNPDARAKAHQSADDLADLGRQLRASLLRVALRGLLDG